MIPGLFLLISDLSGIPLITQSDPGKENNCTANCHTSIHHHLDPSLIHMLQHRWKREKNNVKPEGVWSQYHQKFTPGFESILDYGVQNGLYDVNNHIEKYVLNYASNLLGLKTSLQLGLPLACHSMAFKGFGVAWKVLYCGATVILLPCAFSKNTGEKHEICYK